jgi:hypothetical protein
LIFGLPTFYEPRPESSRVPAKDEGLDVETLAEVKRIRRKTAFQALVIVVPLLALVIYGGLALAGALPHATPASTLPVERTTYITSWRNDAGQTIYVYVSGYNGKTLLGTDRSVMERYGHSSIFNGAGAKCVDRATIFITTPADDVLDSQDVGCGDSYDVYVSPAGRMAIHVAP